MPKQMQPEPSPKEGDVCEESRYLWTTKGELIGLLSFKPSAIAWDPLRAFFLYDQDRPIPLWEILGRCGPWAMLAASAAPAYAAAQNPSSGDYYIRIKTINWFYALAAKIGCLILPIPRGLSDPHTVGWDARWISASEIIGREAGEVLCRMWEQAENRESRPDDLVSWYEELSAAIPLDCIVSLSRRLISGPGDIVRAIVEVVGDTNADTVTNLLLVMRGLAWQYTLRESGMADMARAHDLTNSASPSCDILMTIDREYENLLYGLMFFGPEFVSQLDVDRE